MFATTGIFAAIIGISFLLFSYKYYKRKERIFTTKKMVIYAAFLAIFLIQNLI
jgi:hypothetical protein